ncbi:MAG: thiol:disulfide interchange protein DsbA/DsbL [Gammaproteobacteria bacterium]|nr:thiol:disulfide interchange protein DsbA/DsbL [Gammaproteobacteria bacterium]
MRLDKILIGSLLLLTAVVAQAAVPLRFQEGVDYELVTPAQPTADRTKVEVIEVFWYGCPHCYRFQPYIERWLQTKPDNVDYLRLPAVLNESWALGTQAYYTEEALGVTDKLHAALFDAIHRDKRRLDSEQDMMKFFVEHGVSEDQFRDAYHSFGVESKVQRARQMTQRYGIDGTPSVIINGKYRTGPGMTRSYERLLDVMNFLVAQESRSLAK